MPSSLIFRLTCLIALLCPSSALAEYKYLSQEGHWTTFSHTPRNRCIAINRPGIEVGMYPYVYFSLTRNQGDDGLLVEVFYWPKAFPDGASDTMVIASGDGGAKIEFPAEAALDFAARSKRPINRDEIGILIEHDLLLIRFLRTAIAFEASDLPKVVQALDSCIEGMK